MKVALLIQVHKAPQQVGRLCRAMAHPDIDIYINIDLKSSEAPFREQVPQGRFVEPRTDVRWGGFSQVEATLRSLEYIARSGMAYDYVIFISGQDYPVVTPAELLRQLEEGGRAEYMSYRILSPVRDRLTLRKAEYRHPDIRGKYLPVIARKLIYAMPFLRRRYPVYPVCKGSGWWALTYGCVEHILNFAKDNPQYVKFHRGVHCCDEFFFHNIVLHSPFADRVTGDDRRYIEWIHKIPNPKVLGMADYDKIMASGKWFARKFDCTYDSGILDMLDEAIMGGRSE